MVETAGALEAVATIVHQVKPDGIYVGPADLSASLGCRNSLDDPTFRAAVDHVVGTCRRAGVPVGVHATTPETAASMRDLGCTIVTCLVDQPALAAAAMTALDVARPPAAADMARTPTTRTPPAPT
jgi:2-keto-3-deoxy-L-rhamnonate aldolase RhmA